MSAFQKTYRIGFRIFRRNAGHAYIVKVKKPITIVHSPIVTKKRRKTGGRNMTDVETVKRSTSIAVIIWSNILRQQYLEGWSDKKLCAVLSITTRTLYNYQKDPSVLTLGQVQAVLDQLDIPFTNLLQT